MVKDVRLLLNGVSYCKPFSPTTTTLNVSGLAGGRKYEIKLELVSTNQMFLAQFSKILQVDIDPLCEEGGGREGEKEGGREGRRGGREIENNFIDMTARSRQSDPDSQIHTA